MKATVTSRVAFLIWIVISLTGTTSGENLSSDRLCGVRSEHQQYRVSTDAARRHITASGVFRVLVVFASFPDDEIPHPFWPAHNPPLFMDTFIDPDTATRSQDVHNLTNYFRQMSLGKLHLIGEAIWVETQHSQEEYRNGAYGRANQNVLQESVDPIVDFTLYDQWTKQADFAHANVPDGQVDMILMAWRTNIFEYLGEASLGYRPGFVLDGKRIEMGFPEYLPLPLGSGVTCQYIYTDTPSKVTKTMIHELAHWLLGGLHPYNAESLHGKNTYWGMLCNGLRTSSCANAYERERLGWIIVPEIPTDTDILLPDFVTTGVAYKFHPPNGDPAEYFYMENHQKRSAYDDITSNPDDKGIWILHQQGPYMEVDNFRVRPSDGSWKWTSPGYTQQCFSISLPIFNKGVPQTTSGKSHRDQIPTSSSAINWMRVYNGDDVTVNCGSFFSGERFSGSFTPQFNNVFSSYTNPTTNTWSNQQTSFSLELLSETGGVIHARYHSNQLDAPPARRYLGRNPAVQHQRAGSVHLAWGSHWPEGQLIEPDVAWSELQRQIGNEENWSSVYEGSSMDWTDTSLPYDSNGTVQVQFRVRVRDIDGKYSSWSNLLMTTTGIVSEVDRDSPSESYDYSLVNYPNPFNPSTSICFVVPSAGRVKVTILGLLGIEVSTLLDEYLNRGVHTVTWNGRNNAGLRQATGLYFCHLQIGGRVLFHKMLLVK